MKSNAGTYWLLEAAPLPVGAVPAAAVVAEVPVAVPDFPVADRVVPGSPVAPAVAVVAVVAGPYGIQSIGP